MDRKITVYIRIMFSMGDWGEKSTGREAYSQQTKTNRLVDFSRFLSPIPIPFKQKKKNWKGLRLMFSCSAAFPLLIIHILCHIIQSERKPPQWAPNALLKKLIWLLKAFVVNLRIFSSITHVRAALMTVHFFQFFPAPPYPLLIFLRNALYLLEAGNGQEIVFPILL